GDGLDHPNGDLQATHSLRDRVDDPGTFETRNKGKRLRVVPRAVINIDVVQARRRLAQTHLTRPGLTDLDRCPVQNLETASLPNLNRMRHQGFSQKHKLLALCSGEPIILQVHYYHNDIATSARFCDSLGGGF